MSTPRELIEAHYASFAVGDYATTARIFSPDVETIEPFGTIQGRDAFIGFMDAFRRGFPDARLRLRHAYEAGDTVVVEGSFTGTHTGPLVLPTGEVPPTGAELDLPYCDVVHVRDGQIVSHRVYWDQMAMLGQLGLLPDAADATA